MKGVVRRRGWWLGVVAVLAWGLGDAAAQATTWPTIRAIDFAGNEVTRASVMRRELVVHVGDAADPALIERSRQAILDLGLFNGVTVERKPVEGGVALTFVVKEKWYILPLPRLELNPDGDYGYGGQLRWNNVWGLNHTLRMLIVRRRYQDKDRDGAFTWSGSYSIPFVNDSAYGLSFSGGHSLQDSLTAAGRPYRETFDDAGLLFSRSLSAQPRSLGWRAGAGLSWHRENAFGPDAPPPQGKALGLVGTLSYTDMTFAVYGEHGTTLNFGYERDVQGLDSDYDASLYTADYLRAWFVGTTPYQELRLLAATGVYTGGPGNTAPDYFALGGSQRMRGYASQFVEGDFNYYLGVELLRPLFWNWLRGMVFVEAGSVYPHIDHSAARPVFADVGLGLRLRVIWLVNLELQGGVAFPLVSDGSGRGWRLFAGS